MTVVDDGEVHQRDEMFIETHVHVILQRAELGGIKAMWP